jgi:hypothetical protein
MLCGALFWPWAALWLSPPNWLDAPYVGPTFSFVAYDFSAQLIFVGAACALVSVPWLGFRRNWLGVCQAVIEVAVGFGAAVALPAY